ncbi:hypothetical protein PhCBS80983_g04318 [Powellomyces hirtus]|uniref:Microtubule-associated protein n=1 Tax=Powellomyces hirtus TaxID=109895 RepID=A0A507DZX2_9FUNG|nr:hypothetical protein PhCBS80983_g04318 [Powellomyces hirtus]
MPISSQTLGIQVPRPTTVSTTVRRQSLTPHPGLPPVNTLGMEPKKAARVKSASAHAVHVVVVEPKVGSKDNVHWHKAGGDVKIFDQKLQFKKQAQSRVGSLDNLHWTPPGGEVQIINEPLYFSDRAQSKVGSWDNINHKPQSTYGTRRNSRALSRSVSANALLASSNITFRHSARLSTAAGFFRSPVVSNYVEVPTALPGRRKISSKIGSLDNIHHRPGGGKKRIVDEPIKTAKLSRVASKVGSFENIAHVPGGGQVQITDVPMRPRAHSKVGSLDNIKHKPLGGHVVIVNEPTLYVTKRELAKAAN